MVTYGFYDSLNHDRKYNAMQFSSMFDGIVKDGIFMSIGDCFRVTPSSGMEISVGIGRAWFDHTWTLNDAPLLMTISESDALLNRIDAVIIDVNTSRDVRENNIIVKKGIPSDNAQRPSLINTEEHKQYPLAYISIEAGATEIHAADITSMIGSSSTPYVTGILETVDIDALTDQWQDEFTTWFNELKAILDDDVATNLTRRVVDLEANVVGLQTNFTELDSKYDFTQMTADSPVAPTDNFLINKDFDGNNEKIQARMLLYQLFNIAHVSDSIGSVCTRRNIWRGQNLGSSVSEAQWETIKAGAFNNMFLGDYWLIDDIVWRIVDFDYWRVTGDDSLVNYFHHVVIIPDNAGMFLDAVQMNLTKTAETGFAGSHLKEYGLVQATEKIKNTFGEDHILDHYQWEPSQVKDNRVSWMTKSSSVKVTIPDEMMLFGCTMCAATPLPGVNPFGGYNMMTHQLAAFRIAPELARTGKGLYYWLRDPANNTQFTVLNRNGDTKVYDADSTFSIMPVFALTKY